MRQEMKEAKEESQRLREQNHALSLQLRAAQRRSTKMLAPATPILSPPKVSSMTHTAYANLNTPSMRTQQRTRLSLGVAAADDDDDDKEDEGDGNGELELDEGVDDEAEETSSRRLRSGKSEASEVAKVVAKAIVKPEKFSGESEKERQEVETWVEDVTAWLDSQFSQFYSEGARSSPPRCSASPPGTTMTRL